DHDQPQSGRYLRRRRPDRGAAARRNPPRSSGGTNVAGGGGRVHDGDLASEGGVELVEDRPLPLARRLLAQGMGRNLGLTAALLLAIGIVASFSPTYLSLENLRVVALQMAFVGIASLGTSWMIISGSIDLAIGSIFGLAAVVAAMLSRVIPVPLAIG